MYCCSQHAIGRIVRGGPHNCRPGSPRNGPIRLGRLPFREGYLPWRLPESAGSSPPAWFPIGTSAERGVPAGSCLFCQEPPVTTRYLVRYFYRDPLVITYSLNPTTTRTCVSYASEARSIFLRHVRLHILETREFPRLAAIARL